MTNEELKLLNKSKLLDGIKNCSSNAYDLYQGGVALGELKKYGVANSLMILATEEYIKASVLLATYCNVELNFNVRPIFYKHPEKHLRGKELMPVINFLSASLKVFGMVKNSCSSSLKSFLMDVRGFLSVFSKYDKIKFESWWDSLNSQKNNGLYVDFKNNEWHTPSSIGLEKFQFTKEVVSSFNICFQFIDDLENEDYKLLQSIGK